MPDRERKRVPDNKSDILKGSLPKSPPTHPWDMENHYRGSKPSNTGDKFASWEPWIVWLAAESWKPRPLRSWPALFAPNQSRDTSRPHKIVPPPLSLPPPRPQMLDGWRGHTLLLITRSVTLSLPAMNLCQPLIQTPSHFHSMSDKPLLLWNFFASQFFLFVCLFVSDQGRDTASIGSIR